MANVTSMFKESIQTDGVQQERENLASVVLLLDFPGPSNNTLPSCVLCVQTPSWLNSYLGNSLGNVQCLALEKVRTWNLGWKSNLHACSSPWGLAKLESTYQCNFVSKALLECKIYWLPSSLGDLVTFTNFAWMCPTSPPQAWVKPPLCQLFWPPRIFPNLSTISSYLSHAWMQSPFVVLLRTPPA